MIAQVRSPQFKDQIRLALPGNVSPDRFVRAAVTALLTNPDIATADSNSALQSLIRCAQDGLLPDGQEAALVIYRMRDGTRKVQYIPMIGGFRKIAGEHGWTLRTRVVFEKDEFDHEEGLNTRLIHVPAPVGTDRGEMVAAYCVASHSDGRQEFRVFGSEEIEKRRQKSQRKDAGPWKEWTEQMWEKTVGRDLFNDLPLGDRELVARVVQASSEMPNEILSAMYPELPPAPEPEPEPELVEAELVSDADTVAGPDGQTETDLDLPPVEPGPLALMPEEALRLPVASAQKPPHGSYQTYSLERILAFPNGTEWLEYALRQEWPQDQQFVADLRLFCKARLPEAYTRWIEESA
jgi:recombination protein RecT